MTSEMWFLCGYFAGIVTFGVALIALVLFAKGLKR